MSLSFYTKRNIISTIPLISHMSYSKLLSLPSDVLKAHIFCYLRLRDLSALDIAVSSERARKHLLNTLAQWKPGVQFDIILKSDETIDWVISRGITPERISVGCGVSNHALVKFLKLSCKYLSTISTSFHEFQKINFEDRLDFIARHYFNDELLFVLADSCQFTLQSLDISNALHVSGIGLRQVTQHATQLHTLILNRCMRINDDILREISRNCSVLSKISLEDCKRITDVGFEHLVSCCPLLQYINVNRCISVTDKGILELSRSRCLLKHLFVHDCYEITDKSILPICIRYQTTIESLGLSGTSITTIIYISTKIRQLKVLNVLCDLLVNHTDRDFVNVIENNILLQYFEVNILSNQICDALSLNCSQLKFISCSYIICDMNCYQRLWKSCLDLSEIYCYNTNYIDVLYSPSCTSCSFVSSTSLANVLNLGIAEISCSGDVEWRHIEYTLRKFKNTLKMLCFSKSSSFNLIKYDSLSEFVDANSWKISHVQNWIFRVEYLSLFPLLIHVNLSYNDSLIDSDILNLLSCCQHLSEINVSYCPKITAQSIICIANVPQSIVFFDCEGNYQLCGVDFIVMASRQRRIQHFNITGVSSVGVCEFVVCLAENNGQSLCALLLTDLHIDHHVLRALSCNCPCLSLLSITETSDDHLEIGIPLLAGCESLSVLLISNCSAIVQQSLSALIDVISAHKVSGYRLLFQNKNRNCGLSVQKVRNSIVTI